MRSARAGSSGTSWTRGAGLVLVRTGRATGWDLDSENGCERPVWNRPRAPDLLARAGVDRQPCELITGDRDRLSRARGDVASRIFPDDCGVGRHHVAAVSTVQAGHGGRTAVVALTRSSQVRVTPCSAHEDDGALPGCQRQNDREQSGSEHLRLLDVFIQQEQRQTPMPARRRQALPLVGHGAAADQTDPGCRGISPTSREDSSARTFCRLASRRPDAPRPPALRRLRTRHHRPCGSPIGSPILASRPRIG